MSGVISESSTIVTCIANRFLMLLVAGKYNFEGESHTS